MTPISAPKHFSPTKRISKTDISDALAAYRHEYQLVTDVMFLPPNRLIASVVFSNYPFTVSSIPYASINLINLAAEQAALILLDCQVRAALRRGWWASIDDYRRYVANGHWLVPRLTTSVTQCVPNSLPIDIDIVLAKDRQSPLKHVAWLELSSRPFFSSVAGVLVRTLPSI